LREKHFHLSSKSNLGSNVLLPPTASVKPYPAEPKREGLKKDEEEWLRMWLAWNELAIP
jgi:hypothetical protein